MTAAPSDDLPDPQGPAPEGARSKAGNAFRLRGAASDAPPAADPARFKRSDLFEAVAARSAMKRADLRNVLDLALEEMGRALDEGRDLLLPPLGKVMIKRRNPQAQGDVLVTRIKLHPRGTDPLAELPKDG